MNLARSLNKALCITLSAALTANIGWSLLADDVSALAPSWEDTLTTVILTTTLEGNEVGGSVFYAIRDDNGLCLTNDEFPSHTIDQGRNFIVNQCSVLDTYADYTFRDLTLAGGSGSATSSSLRIWSTISVNGTLEGSGENRIINYGNYVTGAFDAALLAASGIRTFDNGLGRTTGTITADTVTINNTMYSDVAGSSIVVSDTFMKTITSNMNATVVAQPETTVVSLGGSFTLKVGDAVKTITGQVNDQAIDLMDDPGVALGTVPSIVYYGTAYDFSSLISTVSGYGGTPYLEYSTDSGATYSTRRPTYTGTFKVRAVAPANGTYAERVSEAQTFRIDYMPLSEVSSTGNYYTFDGVRNGVYVKGDLIVVPAEGYSISTNLNGIDNYGDTLSLSGAQLGYGNISTLSSIQLRLKSKTDGAVSVAFGVNEGNNPSFRTLVFDSVDPVIRNASADNEAATISDGSTIVADSLSFEIYDTYLESVTVDGTSYTVTNGTASVALNGVLEEPKTVEVYAIDKSGRELDLSFTLRYPMVDPTASVTVPSGILVGDDYEPSVVTNSNGDISFYYLDRSNSNGIHGGDLEGDGQIFEEVSEERPTAAGDYTVIAEISETDDYNATSCSYDYTITKKTPAAQVSVPDTVIGDAYRPTLATNSDGRSDAVYEYKPVGAPDSAYTTTKPTAKGTYTVRATIPETATYFGTVCTSTFTISVKTVAATVAIDDLFVGTAYDPVITTESDGVSRAVFEYRAAGAGDDTFTTTKPVDSGTYVVRATIPETAEYGQIVCSSQFKIEFLPAPSSVYTMEGTSGDNDYFTSDVELKAPAGYSIASSFRGIYRGSIPYTEDLNVVYLRRDSDGALTSAIAVATRPLIDKETPSVTISTGALTDGSVMFRDSLIVKADDDNLASLMINGEPVDLETAGNIMTLSPGNGIATYRITATDIAGNTRVVEFTLMAEWLESRVIPPDLILPLQSGEPYSLGGGYWIVRGSAGEDDSDPTVYNGGLPIFVSEDGEFVFTLVNMD
ncbi:MAG: hypothetical protein J6Z43_08030 [Clostridiales bacterium]|nr:hypothetical protein [Clostridiales bacterium]